MFNLLISMPLASPNEMAKIIISNNYLPLVGQTDSPAHKLMPLVEPMCWADQDARPLSVDKQT